MLITRVWIRTKKYTLWSVETLDCPLIAVAFSINPNLSVVVNASFKLDACSLYRMPVHSLWNGYLNPKPYEAEPVGVSLSQVGADRPVGVVVVGQASGATL